MQPAEYEPMGVPAKNPPIPLLPFTGKMWDWDNPAWVERWKKYNKFQFLSQPTGKNALKWDFRCAGCWDIKYPIRPILVGGRIRPMCGLCLRGRRLALQKMGLIKAVSERDIAKLWHQKKMRSRATYLSEAERKKIEEEVREWCR